MASNASIYDSELTRKVRKTCDKISENLYVVANEPLLACYRLQEHVHKTVPLLTNKTIDMNRTEATLKGLLYDVEYSHSSVRSLHRTVDQFATIQSLLKDCIFFKQQTDYNESVKKRVAERMLQNKDDSIQSDVSSTSDTSSSNQTGSSSIPINTRRSNRSSRASSAFNRFSTSFDFPLHVASSMSADLKSMISQFANSGSSFSSSVTNNNTATTTTTPTISSSPSSTSFFGTSVQQPLTKGSKESLKRASIALDRPVGVATGVSGSKSMHALSLPPPEEEEEEEIVEKMVAVEDTNKVEKKNELESAM